VANKFDFSGDKVTQVTGNLTLMGQTHPITLKASNFNCYDNPKHKREVCGGDFETTLDRSQFGHQLRHRLGLPQKRAPVDPGGSHQAVRRLWPSKVSALTWR